MRRSCASRSISERPLARRLVPERANRPGRSLSAELSLDRPRDDPAVNGARRGRGHDQPPFRFPPGSLTGCRAAIGPTPQCVQISTGGTHPCVSRASCARFGPIGSTERSREMDEKHHRHERDRHGYRPWDEVGDDVSHDGPAAVLAVRCSAALLDCRVDPCAEPSATASIYARRITHRLPGPRPDLAAPRLCRLALPPRAVGETSAAATT